MKNWRATLSRQTRPRWLWAFICVLALGVAASLFFADVVPPNARTWSNINQLKRAIHVYTRANGRPPRSLSDLPVVAVESRLDTWHRPITFRIEPDGRVTLRSLGADGRPGGTGENADCVDTFDPASTADDWPSDPIRLPATRSTTKRTTTVPSPGTPGEG